MILFGLEIFDGLFWSKDVSPFGVDESLTLLCSCMLSGSVRVSSGCSLPIRHVHGVVRFFQVEELRLFVSFYCPET